MLGLVLGQVPSGCYDWARCLLDITAGVGTDAFRMLGKVYEAEVRKIRHKKSNWEGDGSCCRNELGK
jgi:hypothetical protein